jgi:hypothetical protein
MASVMETAEDRSGPARSGSVSSGVVVTPPDAGLRARLEAALGVLGAVVSELDPGCLTGADATVLYQCFAGFERLSTAGKTLLAPRIEASGIWRDTGHSSAATMLASLEGVSAGQAKNTLTIGHRLNQLPGTEDEVRKGSLSSPKLNELTGAGVLDPERESELLKDAATEPLQVLKERCHRSRATSRKVDPLATLRQIRASRHFSSWTDADGAFCYQGRDTADRGAQMLAHLNHVATRLRRSQGSTGDDEREREPERAVRADAFFNLLTQRQIDSRVPVRLAPTPSALSNSNASPPRRRTGSAPPGGPSAVSPGSPPAPSPGLFDPDLDPYPMPDGESDADLDSDLGAPEGPNWSAEGPSADSLTLIDRPPTCSVLVRVDLSALLRGHANEGELCEIDGQGPIPVPMARDLANDSFLRLIFHRAGDIRAVSHLGRTINRALRTALVHRDRTCVVPGCGVAFGLEIDHVIPVAESGPTRLDNLALLCHHHHFLKTYEGWTLSRIGTADDGSPLWRFEGQPPFGQEPDLGIDAGEG